MPSKVAGEGFDNNQVSAKKGGMVEQRSEKRAATR